MKDVDLALEWAEIAIESHTLHEGSYNKNNAKWLREEFIVDNLNLLKSLLLAEFRSGSTSDTFRRLSCDFYEFEYYVLLDDPLFKRNEGVEYVKKSCPHI